jgi:hypothetical protein
MLIEKVEEQLTLFLGPALEMSQRCVWDLVAARPDPYLK